MMIMMMMMTRSLLSGLTSRTHHHRPFILPNGRSLAVSMKCLLTMSNESCSAWSPAKTCAVYSLPTSVFLKWLMFFSRSSALRVTRLFLFTVCGPTIWNELPVNIRSIDIAREQFKRSFNSCCLSAHTTEGESGKQFCLKAPPTNSLTYLLTQLVSALDVCS